eukprot:572789-Prymnesium_polylepis.1
MSLMCRIRISRPQTPRLACEIELDWRELGMHASLELCPSLPKALPRSPERSQTVAACAPFFLPGDPQGAQASLRLLSTWARHMAAQVDLVSVHAVNGGSHVKRELALAAPSLLGDGALEVTSWDWFEVAGVRLRNDSHTARASTGHGAGGRRMNPYHTQVWVLTKSLLEMQDRAHW